MQIAITSISKSTVFSSNQVALLLPKYNDLFINFIKKIWVSATILNKDVYAKRNVSSRNWNNCTTNNHIDKSGLSYIDRKLIRLNKIEQTKHMHTHTGVDNYLYNDNIHTSQTNESYKNVCNDIWLPGFLKKHFSIQLQAYPVLIP